ncbi:MAG: hypothetical protein ABIB98_01300 [bacterium]
MTLSIKANKKSQLPYISIWLMPSGEQMTILQKKVELLSRKYDACSFYPHITVISGFHADPNEIVTVIDEFVGNTGPIKLNIGEVESGNKITKTLFLCLNSTRELDVYRELFNRGLSAYKGVVPNIHLSLLYICERWKKRIKYRSAKGTRT